MLSFFFLKSIFSKSGRYCIRVHTVSDVSIHCVHTALCSDARLRVLLHAHWSLSEREAALGQLTGEDLTVSRWVCDPISVTMAIHANLCYHGNTCTYIYYHGDTCTYICYHGNIRPPFQVCTCG